LITIPPYFDFFELSIDTIRLFLGLKAHYAHRLSNRMSERETSMQIEVQARNFSLTQALHGYVRRRIGFALSARHPHIERIQVLLCDVNGPRGGRDKRCQVRVALPGQATVVIEDIESNLYRAIDRAADRTSRTVARRLERQRDKSRAAPLKSGQPPGGAEQNSYPY
jgi:ribosomal subunit interface protein